MAKINGFAINGISGHAGKLVFYVSNGQQQMRSMPAGYNDKNSATQQNQRYGNFAPMIEYAKQLKGFVKSFFQSRPAGKTAFSEFCHQITDAFGGTKAAPTMDLKLAVVGNGDMPKTSLLTCVKNTTSSVTITWPNTVEEFGESDDDEAYVVISKNDGTSAFVAKTAVVRSTGEADINVPASLTGAHVLVSSVFFISPDGKKTNTIQLQDAIGAVNLA
jgi:hypothetical protein